MNIRIQRHKIPRYAKVNKKNTLVTVIPKQLTLHTYISAIHYARIRHRIYVCIIIYQYSSIPRPIQKVKKIKKQSST